MIHIDFLVVFNQVLVLFSILLLGFILRKIGIIDERGNKNFTNLIIYITLPALIIISMDYDFSLERLVMMRTTLIISAGIYIGMIIISYVIIKLLHPSPKSDEDIYQFMIIFANTAYIGFPVIQVIYGGEGIFLGAIYNVILNLVLWTLGIVIMERRKGEGAKITIKAILNPGIVSVVIGFLIFILSIDLPGPIKDAISMVGGVTSPLALIVVGSTLSQVKIGGTFTNIRLWIVSVIRQVVIPIIALFILRGFNIDPLILGVAVILTAMPVAAMTAIFAQEFRGDSALASEGVFLSTLLSMLTIPLVIQLL
ncbi:AEC family transporter [Halonatronum saccharophilum]|uniref:AEC family transporter n=1 Tax=Halonatronum saccharophilum TaxID=150060 RepID=UPI0004B294D1|nr:AEC family transporter [Halonatronum saccharophilum]